MLCCIEEIFPSKSILLWFVEINNEMKQGLVSTFKSKFSLILHILDKGLSTSVGNVIKSLNPLSFNSTEEISVLDFMHFCLIEYQRLQLKAFHDDKVM